MAIAFKSAAGIFIGSTGTVITMPGGASAPSADDTILVVCESTDSSSSAGTPNTPDGYSKIFEETQGNGAAGCTTLTVFGKRAAGGEGNVTVDGVGNHIIGSLFIYSGAKTTGTAWTVGSGNGANTGNGTMLSVTTPADNCLVIMICASTRDANSGAQFSSWTNANLTSITEREDETTNQGSGGGFGLADGFLASQGASGNSTVTIGTSEQWRSVHIALEPQVGTSYDLTVEISGSLGLSDGMNLGISKNVDLSNIHVFTPATLLGLGAVVPLNETQGFGLASTQNMLASLTLTEIQSITIVGSIVSIVTKGFVVTLDFATNPVTVIDFRANTISTDDSAANSVEASDS